MRALYLTTLIAFALDQASKLGVVFGLNLIERGVIEIWDPFLTFRMAWNTGVNFGLFAHHAEAMRWGLIVLALVIAAWVWRWLARAGAGGLAQIAGGLLIGGAFGNVADRLAYGAVADFLNMSCCGIENPYAFNIADAAIFMGALGLIFFGPSPEKGAAKRP